jgi:hypothetical protein
MASKLFSLLTAAIRQRLRDILLGASAVALASLFLAISMGFGAFAVYVHLSAVEGRSIAALIVCGAYGLLAITILILWAWSRGAFRLRRAAAIAAPPSSSNVNPLHQTFEATGDAQEQLAAIAQVRMSRNLSPMQTVALGLIGGFIVGRRMRKQDNPGSKTNSPSQNRAPEA